ncbi:MAG: peptide chain release factor 2 [Candidatus Sumerlaeia bacterium]|nr:peptide chain release factor 2 [Candidatus Sumerlaeia bacterium]
MTTPFQDTVAQLRDIKQRISTAMDCLDWARRADELSAVEAQTQDGAFWNNQDKAQETLKRLKALRRIVEPWRDLRREAEETLELAELTDEATESAATLTDFARAAAGLEKRLESLETQAMLGEEHDVLNSYLYIKPGAGGTESCDWAQMLMRMYVRWAEKQGFTVNEVDLQPGDEAGIKSVNLLIEGPYAYGHLKAESGVHRLVRISPFDSQKRRHTSFASVYASPEIDESIEVEILDKDLKVDTYRSGGAGGQHVNVTDSAVRITHIPTGIIVQCQNERSQHKNRAGAMKVLRSRLYAHYLEEQRAKVTANEAEKKDIGWGSQIRSYVLQPYQLVKDLRTDVETSSVQAVLDGDITFFMEAYLRSQMGQSRTKS